MLKNGDPTLTITRNTRTTDPYHVIEVAASITRGELSPGPEVRGPGKYWFWCWHLNELGRVRTFAVPLGKVEESFDRIQQKSFQPEQAFPVNYQNVSHENEKKDSNE